MCARARVCVYVIWEKGEGLAKTVMERSGHVSFFFSFLFLYLSLKLKTQPIQLRNRPFNLKGEGGMVFVLKSDAEF